jgi:diacylglycerol kinase family enzyme
MGGTIVRRAAAWLTLVTLAAAVALLAVGAVTNWLWVIIGLAALLVAVAAGWYVVSRSGVVRWLALVVLAASAVLLIGSLVAADLRWPWVLVALVLAAASVGCARVALGRTSRQVRAVSEAAPAAPLQTRRVLIINPKSGGGKATRFRLAQECRARGIEPVVLEPGDDLVLLAENAIAGGAGVIGMAGGDGSQALVATVAAAHGIPHVVVPAGTRNHFALDLGLDRDDVVGALDAFDDGVERRIDLAEVNGRVFVNNASLGIYAAIVQSPQYRDAKLATAAGMLPELLGPDATPLDLRFTGPDGTGYPTAHLILVSNDGYQLDQIGGRGTRERLDDGILGVVAARIDGPAQARQFIALDSVGQIRRFPGWLEWETPRFEVQSADRVRIAIDGEALTMDPPLVFASRPGALLVRVPRRASGLSPAAAAVHLTSRSTLGELAAVAVGRRAALRLGAEGDRGGRRVAVPAVADADLVPRLAGQGDLLELNVARGGLAVEAGDHVAWPQAGLGGRAAGDHVPDEQPLRGLPLVGRGRRGQRHDAEEGVGHGAGADDLVRDGLRQVDGDREAQSDAAAARLAGLGRHGGPGRRHPDQLARAVDHRAAAVAGVDGGVRLDGGHKQRRLVILGRDLDGPVESADNARRDGVRQAERGTEHHHALADVDRGRRSEVDRRQRLGGADLEDGQVGLRVTAGYRRGSGRAVGELHLHGAAVGGVRDHVIVRHDVAAGVDHFARAGAPAAAAPSRDRHHRRQDLRRDRGHVACAGRGRAGHRAR